MTVKDFIENPMIAANNNIRILLYGFPLFDATPVADLHLSDDVLGSEIDHIAKGPSCVDISVVA